MNLDPVTLEGRHVRLVPMTREHVPTLWQAASDPELWRWTVSQLRGEDDMRRYVEEALAAQAQGTALPFVTTDAATGQVAGSTRFANAEGPRVEIGWTWIAAPWQRTAVNTEAKYLMMRHAFETLGLLRVELKTDALAGRHPAYRGARGRDLSQAPGHGERTRARYRLLFRDRRRVAAGKGAPGADARRTARLIGC